MRSFTVALVSGSRGFALGLLFAGLAACGDSAETPAGGGGQASIGGSGGTSSDGGSGAESAQGGQGGSPTTNTGGSGGGTGGIGEPSDVYPAPHPALPQVVDYGGPVLAHPKIVPIFFNNDDADMVTSLTDFSTNIGATEFWSATTAEYGIDAAVSGGVVNVDEAATGVIDDTDIQDWLGGKLNGGDALFPANDADTVYILFYPEAPTITADGGQGCYNFGGYHSNFSLDSAHGNATVAYAVVPRCSNFGPSALDTTTEAASHELVEAATNPHPMSDAAYAMVDLDHIYWLSVLGGGETGDMCAQFGDSYATFPGFDFSVQRSWSNAAAKAGHDPCQPTVDSQPYFNAVPVYTDNVLVSVYGQQFNVKGAKINVGETKTIDVILYSDADTGGPFHVTAGDLSEAFGGPKRLELALDESDGQNGQKLHLSITVLMASMKKTESFYLKSEQNGHEHLYFGIVGSPQ